MSFLLKTPHDFPKNPDTLFSADPAGTIGKLFIALGRGLSINMNKQSPDLSTKDKTIP